MEFRMFCTTGDAHSELLRGWGDLGNGRGILGVVVRLIQPLPGIEPQRKGLGGGTPLPAAQDGIWESTGCTWE